MKTKIILTTLAIGLATIDSHLSTVHAQGALTPPGAPAPTMKSLDQVEARTAITNRNSLVTISQPGSYYLTGNLTVTTGNGIDIITNGVTLDLNGFTIRSAAASATGYGILLNSSGPNDTTILNGHIRGSVTNNGAGVYGGNGFLYGINYIGALPKNVLVSRVSVSGCLTYGIYLDTGDSTVVEGCTVRTAGFQGIVASTVKGSSAVDCGSGGISGTAVSDSRGESVGTGIFAATAQNCYGEGGSGAGVNCTSGQNCYGNSNTSSGIFANSAMNCFGQSNTGIGVNTKTANNCTGWRTGGTAIQSTIATGCYAAVGTNLITYKYNMP